MPSDNYSPKMKRSRWVRIADQTFLERFDIDWSFLPFLGQSQRRKPTVANSRCGSPKFASHRNRRWFDGRTKEFRPDFVRFHLADRRNGVGGIRSKLFRKTILCRFCEIGNAEFCFQDLRSAEAAVMYSRHGQVLVREQLVLVDRSPLNMIQRKGYVFFCFLCGLFWNVSFRSRLETNDPHRVLIMTITEIRYPITIVSTNVLFWWAKTHVAFGFLERNLSHHSSFWKRSSYRNQSSTDRAGIGGIWHCWGGEEGKTRVEWSGYLRRLLFVESRIC